LYALINYYGPGLFNEFSIGGLKLLTPLSVFQTSLIKFNTQDGMGMWVSNVDASAVTVDGQGNSFAVGSFRNTLSVGTRSLTATSPSDVFVARFDAGGTLLGLNSLGANRPATPVRIATVPDGRSDEGAVVSLMRPSNATSLLSLRTDGTVDWEEQVSIAATRGLAVAPGPGQPHGRVLLGGTFTNQAQFGKLRLSANGTTPFLASLTFRRASRSNASKEIASANKVSLYPNPVREAFTLRLPAQPGGQLQLVNLHGRVVHEQRLAASGVEGEVNVDVKRLPRGLYTLRLSTAGQTETLQVQLD
jgi:hypothetical protein